MPDLLLELFSEEIPARMQAKAADDLKAMITNGLVEAGLTYEGAAAYATPRRLALTVHGVEARSKDVREEKKGPRVGAPEQAIAGFLKGAGLESLDQARVVDDKKGNYYVAESVKPGRETTDILSDLVPTVVKTFPWPKSQRWGAGTLRWVRPLHSVLCTFGPETEEPTVVNVEIEGVASGNLTYGHRFHAPGAIKVRRFADYAPALEKAFVVLDPARRRDIILHDARDLALAHGLELVEDEGLLHEVAGLVEWPVVLIGSFEEAFLDVPDEVIRATIRANQKCFVLKDPNRTAEGGKPDRASVGQAGPAQAEENKGRLTNKFILTANRVPTDGGATIIAGNERVIRARLSDAKFFWEQDLAIKLEDRLPKLDLITFHEKLGTQGARVQRIAALAREIAPLVGANADLSERAARLAKADLVSGMVGEFPELQGLMGRYYAQRHGEVADVAFAIEEHYKPQGPSDRVPTNPVSIAVALADKLDILTGFWAIDEKPTGSKDPYALRRAALGVIRIILENGLRVKLGTWASADLLAFFADRLKVQLKDQGVRHDLVDAVLALGNQDDLTLLVRRVEALGAFLATENGKNLLAGYTRAANILKAEEKKGTQISDKIDLSLLVESSEKELHTSLVRAASDAASAVAREDFSAAMAALATLRAPVDAFFTQVLVNADDAALRANRLGLLTAIRAAVHTVADFSKVEA